MIFLSQLLGAPVEDPQGTRVAKIVDVIVELAQVSQPGPVLPRALIAEGQADQRWAITPDVVEWRDGVLRLRRPIEQFPLHPAEKSPQEISLAEDVLDKQVIDIARKKAVRVNDVCFSDNWQLLGIDNSTLGLVRRLAPNWLLGAKNRPTSTNLIPWEQIELSGVQRQTEAEAQTPQPAPPRPQSGHLAEMHPADIAEIVHQLTPGQGAQLIERLDDETAADAMEEIDTERQRQILENIQPERAADILEAMGPDEAADLLSQLSEERAKELLRLMKREESEDVQELLEPHRVTGQPVPVARPVDKIMKMYILLAVPVVRKNNNILEGVVTVDDARVVFFPADKRRKPTRMY